MILLCRILAAGTRLKFLILLGLHHEEAEYEQHDAEQGERVLDVRSRSIQFRNSLLKLHLVGFRSTAEIRGRVSTAVYRLTRDPRSN